MESRRQFLWQSVAVTLGLATRSRADKRPGEKKARKGITPEARKAIDAGLAYLAGAQNQDGSFGTGSLKGEVAVSSLAGLALVAGGYGPDSPTYGGVLTRVLDYVLGQEDPKRPGYLHCQDRTNYPMYGQGYGTLFLARARGLAKDGKQGEQRGAALKRAVALIVKSQNATGGWRYLPVSKDADLSVTACQMAALHAASQAGVSVPEETVQRGVRFVKDCRDPASGGFCYMRNLTGGPGFARTAAAVTTLFNAGISEGKEVEGGLKYLIRWLRDGRKGAPHDLYYFYGHYYAVQAMRAAGGAYWAEWFPSIRDELVNPSRRRSDGSWADPVSNHYATGMACLILQAPGHSGPGA